jgi:hypothetical protein
VIFIAFFEAPLHSIYFHAKNSWLFYYFLKLAAPSAPQNYLRKFLVKKRRVIKVRIGRPISVAEQNEYKTIRPIQNS